MQESRPGLPVFLWQPEYKEKPVDYVFHGHQHDCFELCYLDRGPVKVQVEGRCFEAQGGAYFLFSPNHRHAFSAGPGIAPNIAFAHFHLPGWEEACPRLFEQRYEFSRPTPLMRQLIRRIFSDWESAEINGKLLAAVHLAEFLLLTLQTEVVCPAPPSRRVTENSQQGLVSQAELYLEEHLAEPIKIGDVATVLAVAESTLRHAFRRITGRAISARLEELRSVRAKELLRESSLTITEIASRVGFTSVSTFSRAFKRLNGVCPSEYSRSVL